MEARYSLLYYVLLVLVTSDSKKFSILKKGIEIEGEKTIETS